MLLQIQTTNYQRDIIVAIVTATIVFLLLAFLIVAILLTYQRRRHQHTLEISDMKNKYEAELLKSQLEIQEQTLRTISQEIHDNIGQVLSLAKLQLYSLKSNCGEADIHPTTELIGQAINDLRNLSKSLNPDRIADIGLMESIRHELQLLQKTNAMETMFEVTGSMQRLPAEKEIIVFRIFQELMNNSIKHSKATVLKTCIDYQSNALVLSIADNGIGFDRESKTGIGLNSIKSRAAMINGVLQIDTAKNNGTQTILTVPL
ncbi:MAG: ATP-binding protein [Bacteroidota bacterium]